MSEPEDPKQPATVGAPGAETPQPGDAGDEPAAAELDDVDMRDLLRSALRPAPAPRLLHGVQRRLRSRSRGKFYGDGWSTARSPRTTYLVTTLLMLLLIGFVFVVLIPWSGMALP